MYVRTHAAAKSQDFEHLILQFYDPLVTQVAEANI